MLVVDLDAQANASHWLGVPDPCLSVTDVLLNQTPVNAAVVPSSVPLVSVLPATGDLKRPGSSWAG